MQQSFIQTKLQLDMLLLHIRMYSTVHAQRLGILLVVWWRKLTGVRGTDAAGITDTTCEVRLQVHAHAGSVQGTCIIEREAHTLDAGAIASLTRLRNRMRGAASCLRLVVSA